MTGRRTLAIFLPRLSPGGAERVALLLAPALHARGWEVDIVTAIAGGAWSDRVPRYVRHIEFGAGKPLHAIGRLLRYLQRERPTILLSSVFAANVAAVIACRLSGIPVVLREANRTEDDIRDPRPLTRALNWLTLRLLYPRASAVIALSHGLGDHVARFAGVPRERVHVIPNPAPTGPAAVRVKAPGARSRLLACGRLEVQKDFSTLLHAFARLRSGRRCELTIVGSGSQESALRALCRELAIEADVNFETTVSELDPWLSQADLFVLSSRWEGFPNVVLEALHAGVPVVATRCSDAVEDLLDGGRFGALVPPGDADALADAIAGVLDGRRAFPSAHEALAAYHPATIADRYDTLLTTVAGR